VLHRRTDHKDFIYSLAAVGGLALSGGGDGSLLVNDVCSGQLLYCLGSNRAAVRAAHASPHRLVCAGDDGGVMVYTFEADTERADGPRVASAGRAGGGGGAENRQTEEPRAEGTRPALGPSHGRRAAGFPSGIAPPPVPIVRSQAHVFAEKKRIAMERAAAIRAEQQGAAAARDGPSRAVGGSGPPLSELDMLHALGDQKFGRGRG